MAIPKTFTAGERLFAADLNDNFVSLDTDIGNAGPEFTTAGSNTVNVAFNKDRVITRSATGNITFTGSSYTAGKSATVRIVAGGAQRTLTFPAGWVFVSDKPTALPANKTGVLALVSVTTAESGVTVAWGRQP